ncbi:hypothetical protein Hanom_Chr07g00611021 [Helianthus anomalus]
MDGFNGNSGVIVLAATNTPKILDSTLLRPWWFDRQGCALFMVGFFCDLFMVGFFCDFRFMLGYHTSFLPSSRYFSLGKFTFLPFILFLSACVLLKLCKIQWTKYKLDIYMHCSFGWTEVCKFT